MQGHKEIVRRIYEIGISRNDPSVFDALIHPDYLDAAGGRGAAGYAANVESLRVGFPDIRFSLEDLIADGDRVAARWRWTGTHTGPFRGIAPTERAVQNTGIVIYQLAGGRVLRAWLEVDRLGVLQQLGVEAPSSGTLRPG